MNIEQRVNSLESANRWYRGILVALFALALVVVFVAASQRRESDTLSTPVEVRNQSGSIVLKITDEGHLEFFEKGWAVSKLHRATLVEYEDALSEQAADIRELQSTSRSQVDAQKNFERRLRAVEKHVASDQRIR